MVVVALISFVFLSGCGLNERQEILHIRLMIIFPHLLPFKFFFSNRNI